MTKEEEKLIKLEGLLHWFNHNKKISAKPSEKIVNICDYLLESLEGLKAFEDKIIDENKDD